MNIKDLAFIESHYVKMMFYPNAWEKHQTLNLKWTNYDFPPNPSNIPDKPGVYAFVVEPNLFSLNPANGLFYIGKTNSLYNRVGSYKSELNKALTDTKRPLVWKMLHQWNGHLKYYFSTTTDEKEAKMIEQHMINALRPPFNIQYEAETSKVMRAFQ
ncbi:GIY-YIG nuclease family protein [Aeromonas jandaei]|uniref:GIY-YIG nuclease family protein n=1 Tax=Aeromonas jandaei TaxID=650 RepID=UPI00227A5457|nr:GIY-YIG nuclease family protein [Aeromonas jandaei]WAG08210.1 GIY-YIG nuclease family protein [Aeromonas jandaei]